MVQMGALLPVLPGHLPSLPAVPSLQSWASTCGVGDSWDTPTPLTMLACPGTGMREDLGVVSRYRGNSCGVGGTGASHAQGSRWLPAGAGKDFFLMLLGEV